MKIRPIAPALLFLGLLLPLQEALYRVTRVIDGDTIEIELGGRRERVRYIGIDTPELGDRRAEVRRLAVRASEANARLVKGRRVRLELDVERRDRYGRLLAYVWVGDTLANEWLVRRGFARIYTYPPNVRYAERFLAAERAAREEGRGLWGEGERRVERQGKRQGERRAEPSPLSRGQDRPEVRPPAPIPAAEADRHVGDWATVCGRVVEARYVRGIRGRPTFLNFERPYPRQPFTVVIWGRVRARFSQPPEQRFDGREVCVEGPITRYRGTPQIVVEDPSQLRVRTGD
ncbi:MAG: thermonuclease family protein [Gemmatimonadota bacterium]